MHPFALERDRLLADIVAAVENDQRFVSGWLSGSYGRLPPILSSPKSIFQHNLHRPPPRLPNANSKLQNPLLSFG